MWGIGPRRRQWSMQRSKSTRSAKWLSAMGRSCNEAPASRSIEPDRATYRRFCRPQASPEPAVRCRGQGAANVRWLSEHRGDHDPCRDYPSCRRRILLEPNTYTTAKFQSLGRGYWPIVRVDGRTWHRRSLARHDETTPTRPATSALYSGPAESSAAYGLGRTAFRW